VESGWYGRFIATLEHDQRSCGIVRRPCSVIHCETGGPLDGAHKGVVFGNVLFYFSRHVKCRFVWPAGEVEKLIQVHGWWLELRKPVQEAKSDPNCSSCIRRDRWSIEVVITRKITFQGVRWRMSWRRTRTSVPANESVWQISDNVSSKSTTVWKGGTILVTDLDTRADRTLIGPLNLQNPGSQRNRKTTEAFEASLPFTLCVPPRHQCAFSKQFISRRRRATFCELPALEAVGCLHPANSQMSASAGARNKRPLHYNKTSKAKSSSLDQFRAGLSHPTLQSAHRMPVIGAGS
jgi:hypothetical protein